jgi:hypothetical protein
VPYEHRTARPIPFRRFAARVAKHVAFSTALVGASLLLGMAGYAHFEGLAWRDAFVNAAMLLGGMGPVDAPKTPGGKIFAGLFALYCGLVFLVAGGIVLAPVFHRLLHRFHWIEESERKR